MPAPKTLGVLEEWAARLTDPDHKDALKSRDLNLHDEYHGIPGQSYGRSKRALRLH